MPHAVESGRGGLMFQPVPGVASVVPRFQMPGSPPMENVHHVSTDDGWDAAKLTGLGNAYMTWWNAAVGGISPRGLTNANCQLLSVTCTDLTTEFGAQSVVLPSGGPRAGTGSATNVNAGLTFATKFGTALRGKSFRGRMYWVGLQADAFSVDAQQVNASSTAAMVALAFNLSVVIHAANAHWQLAVVSRFNKSLRSDSNLKGERDAGIATPVTYASVTDQWIDYQRKRAGGHRGGR